MEQVIRKNGSLKPLEEIPKKESFLQRVGLKLWEWFQDPLGPIEETVGQQQGPVLHIHLVKDGKAPDFQGKPMTKREMGEVHLRGSLNRREHRDRGPHKAPLSYQGKGTKRNKVS